MNIKFTKESRELQPEDWAKVAMMKHGFHISEETGAILFKEDGSTGNHRAVVIHNDGSLTIGPLSVANFKHVEITEIKYKEIE